MNRDFLDLLAKATAVKVDRSHEVSYTAGYSKDGKIIYIDKHFSKSQPIKYLEKGGPGSGVKGHKKFMPKVIHETIKIDPSGEPEIAELSEEELVRIRNHFDEAQHGKRNEKNPSLESPEENSSRRHALERKLRMKKSEFLNNLIKAGASGEGSRGGHIIGHTKSGKPIYATDNKPHPGEEAHRLQLTTRERKETYMPTEGTTPHYTDTKSLSAYKKLITEFKKRGLDFQGHITYDPKTDKIKALTPKGEQEMHKIAQEFLNRLSATQAAQ